MTREPKDEGIVGGVLRSCKAHAWGLAGIALAIFMAVVIFSGIGRNSLVRDASGIVIAISARAIYKGSRRRRDRSQTQT